MNEALKQMGFPIHPVDAYRYFVGNSMRTETIRALPADQRDEEETIEKTLALAKEYYYQMFSLESKPYPGVEQMLREVEKMDLPMAVFSNKPQVFAELTIEKLLPGYKFEIVQGVGPEVPKKPDPAGAFKIAGEMGVKPADILFLGDSDTDMGTATEAGMYPVGALWGFRTAEELKATGAKKLIGSPLQLLDILNSTPS